LKFRHFRLAASFGTRSLTSGAAARGFFMLRAEALAEPLAERKSRPMNTGKIPVPLLTGMGFAWVPGG
jgi:hypothetical protein